MNFTNFLQVVAVNALPVIFAITVHEAAHGYAARHFGDTTAQMMGRITLNPLKHIDPIGTLLFPLVTLLLGSGFFFGWAKPVPVSINNLRHPKRDMIWVAAAGPASNLVMALMWALLAKVLGGAPGMPAIEFWTMVAHAGIIWNVLLMVLNLFPLLPLDGGRMLQGLLPDRLSYSFSRLEPYGMLILIVLIVSGALSFVFRPVQVGLLGLIASVFGLQ